MAEYISDNPHIIVKSFLHSGITSALDGVTESEALDIDLDQNELSEDYVNDNDTSEVETDSES